MISQFFILSPRGDTVITRDYLGNVPKARLTLKKSVNCKVLRPVVHIAHTCCREVLRCSIGKSSSGMARGRMHHQSSM